MGMQFTVNITGTAEFRDMDASDVGIDADEVISNEVGYTSVEFENARIEQGTVTVAAEVRIEDYEVEASDIESFDAQETLESLIDSYSLSLTDTDFSITDSPTGFETLEARIGRESAIEVYGVLASNGFEVTEA